MSEPAETSVLFLLREIDGIPYPSGHYVLEGVSGTNAFLSMVEENGNGDLVPTDRRYTILREDLLAFDDTGQRAIMDERENWWEMVRRMEGQ